MFDTPTEICLQVLREAEFKPGINEDALRASASGGMILCVLGARWCKKRLLLRDTNVDPFMLNGTKKWLADNTPEEVPDIRHNLHLWRTTRLGDALYSMIKYNVASVDVIRQRFQKETTHSCFTELEVGRFLLCRDFRLAYVLESGVRGKDYDIDAEKGGIHISVEANSKRGNDFNISTIENTIRTRRNQVPNNRPAILCIDVPQNWAPDDMDRIMLYNNAVSNVWRRSGRWSALLLQWERIKRLSEGVAIGREFRVCYNERARMPFDRRFFEGNGHLFHPASSSFYDALTALRQRRKDAGELPQDLMPGPFALH